MAFAERCNLVGNPRRRNRLMARRSFWERAGVLAWACGAAARREGPSFGATGASSGLSDTRTGNLNYWQDAFLEHHVWPVTCFCYAPVLVLLRGLQRVLLLFHVAPQACPQGLGLAPGRLITRLS